LKNEIKTFFSNSEEELPEETAESPEMVICRVIFRCNLLPVIMAPPKENVRRDSHSEKYVLQNFLC
jgi:hypothetical protein